MKKSLFLIFLAVNAFCTISVAQRENDNAAFRVLAISESGGHHIAYSREAKIWLDRWAKELNFKIDYIENTDQIL